MSHILILGCPGSGKSTLSRRLAAKTSLPLVHLDRFYWTSGWKEREREQWQELIEEQLAKPAWIMDGNYGGLSNAACRRPTK
jgi:adenylate kinase family enzyme